jgi:hypothetical protein
MLRRLNCVLFGPNLPLESERARFAWLAVAMGACD